MKKIILTLMGAMLLASAGMAQVVTTDPLFPTADDEITFTYNALEGVSGLEGAEKVYIHTGALLPGANDSEWNNVIGNWGEDDGIGLMTKTPDTELWTITFTPRDYYTGDVDFSTETIDRLGMVFRNADGTASGRSEFDSDIFVEIYEPDEYDARLISPSIPNILKDQGETFTIFAASSLTASLSISVNGAEVANTEADTEISYDLLIGDESTYEVTFTAERDGEETITVTRRIIRQVPTPVLALPDNTIAGINYVDNSTVTLSLFAPGKDFVYLIGDFNDWSIEPEYLMNVTPDGNHFWYTLEGLTPNREYLFQYVVDGELTIADPYAEKVVDQQDRFINFLSDGQTTYMANDELIPYPDGETQGRISVFETNQQEFPWQHDDYDRPDPEDLLVYELLIRDFVDQHDYKTVMDTLDYLERLGINAIELMPIMEFENNDSWGYNPSFHLAPDKYYGPKDDLKAFIDECHRRGIAVILDMVLNHAFGQSPLAQLYFDGGKPTEESPWFNIDPTHPFNVGYDFNHEKPATQEFVDRVNRFWLEEYHFDGYRFDLIKGFTQNEGGNSTDNNSAYDQSRVDIVTRMANKIWEFDPDAYVILEAFLDNSEESVYQDLGMMPWGSEHFTFKDAMIGNIQRSNFGGLYAGNRGRNSDLMVGYFESHDEERMMYEGINFGASGDSYNIQDTVTSLNRIKLLAAFTYLVPGPKMLWMFGELGYDYELNNDRLGRKPIRWDYLQDPERLKLYKAYSAILQLRRQHENLIAEADFEWVTNGSAKGITITHPDLNVVVIGNFSTGVRLIDPNFQNTGEWYDFFTGKAIQVSSLGDFYELQPGEFHIFTDLPQEVPEEGLVPFDVATVTGIPEALQDGTVSIFPNPTVNGKLNIRQSRPESMAVQVLSLTGKQLDAFKINPGGQAADYLYDMSTYEKGVYLLRITREGNTFTAKVFNN